MGNSNSTPDWEYTGDGGKWDAFWAGVFQGGGEFYASPITTTAQAAMDFHNAGDVSSAWANSSYSNS